MRLSRLGIQAEDGENGTDDAQLISTWGIKTTSTLCPFLQSQEQNHGCVVCIPTSTSIQEQKQVQHVAFEIQLHSNTHHPSPLHMPEIRCGGQRPCCFSMTPLFWGFPAFYFQIGTSLHRLNYWQKVFIC